MVIRANWKWITGMALTSIFVLMGLFGSLLAPYDKDDATPVQLIITEEGTIVHSAPYPPSWQYPLGTNKWGYDILSLLLTGAKFTVFSSMGIAALRVLIGGGFGMYMALSGKNIIQKPKITIFSGIPMFIIIYFVMVGITIKTAANLVDPFVLVIIQSSLMVILGVPSVYQTVYGKTLEIRKNLFVIASESFGGSKIHILRRHILPLLKENMLVIFIHEVILVLNLIGQLAIFDLFFGGTELQLNPPLYHSVSNEWAGLISQSRITIFSAPWIVGFPLLFYLIYLFSLYLLLTGIKDGMRDSYRLQPHI